MTEATAQEARPASPGMSRGLTLLFAVAGGAAVGNLYWAQPLLGVIADDFDMSTSSAGLAVTLTQVGYALGVFFLVPLGDVVDRKKAIPVLMGGAAVALLATAAAPSFSVLLATLALIGVTTVAGQLITPLAGDLSTDEQRGRVLGTVASGLVLGLLVSRAISGIVADLLGWRAVYVAAAVIMVVLTLVMARRLPTLPARGSVPYGALLLSVLRTVRSRTVVTVMLIGSLTMCVFTMFWTGLTYLLSADPFGFSATQIGLVSLIGVVGAIAGMQVGKLFDRGLGVPVIGVALSVILVGLVVSGLGSRLALVIFASVALFSVGAQAVQVLAQTRMLSIDPAARSRHNTVFIVGNFIGGAVGSALAGTLWQAGGWPFVMVVAACLPGAALTVWAVQRRRALA